MNRQWWLAEFPTGNISARHFRMTESDVPRPKNGEILVRHLYLSLIPANRAYMNQETYRAKLDPGQVMAGRALGRVVESCHPDFSEGQLVETTRGWQDYCICGPDELIARDNRRPPQHLLGILGSSALAAYFGLLHVGRPRAGETLLISAAAGGVGSVVAQLGKIAGCGVIGVAGGAAKCAWLIDEIGIDRAVDYKSDRFASDLADSHTDGFDIFFDNTGGFVFETALAQMRNHGRIVCCGNTAMYDTSLPDHGPRGVPLALILKSLTMTGFVQMSFQSKRMEAEAKLWEWLEEGRLKPVYHIVENLQNAPEALVGMLAGANKGMTLVKV